MVAPPKLPCVADSPILRVEALDYYQTTLRVELVERYQQRHQWQAIVCNKRLSQPSPKPLSQFLVVATVSYQLPWQLWSHGVPRNDVETLAY